MHDLPTYFLRDSSTSTSNWTSVAGSNSPAVAAKEKTQEKGSTSQSVVVMADDAPRGRNGSEALTITRVAIEEKNDQKAPRSEVGKTRTRFVEEYALISGKVAIS